ncbi:MAG TPA: restriction endonuclease [Burkholderiales bacterium]|nr:restriction endonuclease [Burkholderiales bacterium]
MSSSFSRQLIAVASPPLLAAILVYLGLTQGLPRLTVIEPAFELITTRLVDLAAILAGGFALIAVLAVLRLCWQRLTNIDPEVAELRALSWPRFTAAVAEALRRQGYAVAMRRNGEGVEMVATRRAEKMLVQCRHWRVRRVDVEHLRELCGAITTEKANRGLFVTCGKFTLDAMRFAKDLPIGLMDGEALVQMVRGEVSSSKLERILVGEAMNLTRRAT